MNNRPMLTIFLCFVCSCGVTDAALEMARTAAEFSSVADPVLRAKYGAELRACETRPEEQIDPCVLHVRKDWEAVRRGLTDIRFAWCKFEPEKCIK